MALLEHATSGQRYSSLPPGRRWAWAWRSSSAALDPLRLSDRLLRVVQIEQCRVCLGELRTDRRDLQPRAGTADGRSLRTGQEERRRAQPGAMARAPLVCPGK